MPFPNEHAARQKSPDLFVADSFRSVSSGFPPGLRAIMGKLKSDPNGPMVIQTLRFDRRRWTPERARKWLVDHGLKARLEVATNKDFWDGAT